MDESGNTVSQTLYRGCSHLSCEFKEANHGTTGSKRKTISQKTSSEAKRNEIPCTLLQKQLAARKTRREKDGEKEGGGGGGMANWFKWGTSLQSFGCFQEVRRVKEEREWRQSQ